MAVCTGVTLADLDVIELNEAFAAQALAVLREWGISADDERLNRSIAIKQLRTQHGVTEAETEVITQRAIREANATNESLIAAMPDMLFQLDGELRIVRHHAASAGDLAMPPSSFLGRRLDEVMSADTARRFGAVRAARCQENGITPQSGGQAR